MFWLLMILFGFSIVSYRKSKGHRHKSALQILLGDLTAFSVFALILVLLQTPVFDPRTGEYADSEAYGRIVFGLIVFSIIFGIAYALVRAKEKEPK